MESFTSELAIFVLACFVGYYVVWRVTPALHSPLMAVTNAVSSVIIVGAIVAAGPAGFGFSKVMGFFAIILASINIFGGFIVTRRMLSMFKKKTSPELSARGAATLSHNLPAILYLVASICFIMALRGLSSPETVARRQHVRHGRHGDRHPDHAVRADRRRLSSPSWLAW